MCDDCDQKCENIVSCASLVCYNLKKLSSEIGKVAQKFPNILGTALLETPWRYMFICSSIVHTC